MRHKINFAQKKMQSNAVGVKQTVNANTMRTVNAIIPTTVIKKHLMAIVPHQNEQNAVIEVTILWRKKLTKRRLKNYEI